jgi:hypothetical protein
MLCSVQYDPMRCRLKYAQPRLYDQQDKRRRVRRYLHEMAELQVYDQAPPELEALRRVHIPRRLPPQYSAVRRVDPQVRHQ